MKKIHRTMIYPFDRESVSLVRHCNMIDNVKFVKLISLNGWGFTGKDASCVDNGPIIGITVENNYTDSLKSCDTVLFCKPSVEIDVRRYIYPKIIEAAESVKNIICTLELEKDIKEKVEEICKKNNTIFKYYADKYNDIEKPESKRIFNISTPIICVTGTCEHTNKFEVQLNLKEKIQNMGYRVAHIASRRGCELLNSHSFPDFMYSNQISEEAKIILFNYYVKYIENTENPDVIIVGVPGGIIPYNNNFTEGFGIIAYEISQAIKADVVIFSTLCENLESGFLEAVTNTYKYKFGENIDCINIANSAVNIENSELSGKLQFNSIDWTYVDKKKIQCKCNDVDIYNCFNEDDMNAMVKLVIDKLVTYGENESI